MFFRRVFSRKDHSEPAIDEHLDLSSARALPLDSLNTHSPSYRVLRRSASSDEKSATRNSATSIQLTPLWEHIIRTKCLPEHINLKELFDEFGERLRDPEWQVRQHALRVLVDVLIVMGPRSDQFVPPIILPLVENLGHATPAVRKGALDALKVYMTETAMPETIILEIINLGMERKQLNEQLNGRICIGVMLSMPSLVYTSMGTAKQNYILRAVINALTTKMVQVTYQEIALKMLLRIREMVGVREFSEYIAHGAYREFELLCNVYGLPSTPTNQADTMLDLYLPQASDTGRSWNQMLSSAETNSNCKVKRTELCWRDKDDSNEDSNNNNNNSNSSSNNTNNNKIEMHFHNSRNSAEFTRQKLRKKLTDGGDDERVIMETEIKIDNTAVMMRILETSDDNDKNIEFDGICDNSEDDLSSVYEHSGIVRVLTDSELDETNSATMEAEQSARNTARRVTFGGEEVKLRTPDSDSVLQSDSDDLMRTKVIQIDEAKNASNSNSSSSSSSSNSSDGRSALAAHKNDVPISLTVTRPKTASAVASSSPPLIESNPNTLSVRHKSASPIKRNRRPSYSSADETIVSPKISHKGIEVLHNLQQRSPSVSPTRSRRNSTAEPMPEPEHATMESVQKDDALAASTSLPPPQNDKKTNWESLKLVSDECVQNVKSGDWRLRSNAMCTIEEMLKSPDNLYKIQPQLESLFRTLLLSEKHSDVIEDKRRIIINLISRLPLENLESRAHQIIVGVCRQGGPGANRVAKSLMQRLPPTVVVHKLISDDFLKARGAKFRENALQMVLYALMTFPSTYFDISTCVKKSAEAASDRKKRVRQAALDVLAVLGQISSAKIVIDEVVRSLTNAPDSARLTAAIKARLSRKQLPTVTPDGGVQYALRIPTPPQATNNYFFGADIDWITAGIGSVSPTSLKKRNDAIQQTYNYSSSDSNRSYTDNFKGGTKDSMSNLFSPSQDYEYGNRYSNENMALGHHKDAPDDKNTHFVIASTIASTDQPFIFPGGMQRTNLQSQSFPDLSRKIELRSMKGGGGGSGDGGNVRPMYKSSKLPVASRFPSMESNIEVRSTGNSKTEFNNLFNTSNRAIYSNQRLNRSLPRKFKTTSIPVRHAYPNYSHGVLDYQSSNDEPNNSSRPLTHPMENSQPISKRFINVNRYFSEKSSDSDATDKYANDFSYKDHKPALSSEESIPITSPSSDEIQQNSFNSVEQRHAEINYDSISNEIHAITGQHGEQNPSDEHHLAFVPKIETNAPLEIEIDSNDDDELSNRDDDSDRRRPQSKASTNTTKSMRDDDDVDVVDEAAQPQSVASAVNDETHSPANDDNTKGSIEQQLLPSNAHSLDAREERTVEMHAIENESDKILVHNEFIPDEIVSELAQSKMDYDSRSLTSTEESSDYPVATQPTKRIEEPLPIATENINAIKPNAKFRPTVPLHRNKGTVAVKSSPSISQHPSQSTKTSKLLSSNLRKFEKPREASVSCLAQLDNVNWEITMNGLQNFVRLIRHHPEIVEANFHTYCVALAKQVRNLRSQVSRSACQASAEFFETHAKQMEQEPDDLAAQLLSRTADTNKFLRGDASRALHAMCDNLPPTKVIQTLITRGASHQNAIVRTAAAHLCCRIVSRLGGDKVYGLHRECRDKLILAGANFLMEGSLETRNSAKVFFKQISNHPQYNRILLDVIPPRIYRNIEKALRSIK